MNRGCKIFTGLFVPDEEEVGTPERDATEARFGGVVVGWNRREAKKAAERFAMTEKIVRRFAHGRTRLERVAVATRPAKKTSEQGTRSLFTQRKMGGGPNDACIFGLAFDEVDGGDEIERFGRVAVLAGFVDASRRT